MSGARIDVRKAWVIAARNAVASGRDPRLLFFALLLPLLIVFLVGSLFGADATKVPLGVAGADGGPAARALVARLEASPQVKVKTYADVAAVRREVRRGRMSAGVVIPPAYDPAPTGAAAAGGSMGSTGAVMFISQRGRVETAVARTAIEAALDATDGRATGDGAGSRVATMRPVRLELPGGAPDEEPSAFAYTSASNLVLFTFVNTLAVGGMLAASRRAGLIARMLATPTSPATVMLGESAARFIIGLAQAMGLLAVGTLIFGVRWGSPLGVAALVLAYVTVSTAAGMLFGTMLTSEDQAVPIAAPVGIAMAMLGGCMWSLEGVSPLLRAIGHVTPHAWAMDGFVSLLYGGPVTSIGKPVAVLVGFGLVLGTAAAINLRRVVVNPH